MYFYNNLGKHTPRRVRIVSLLLMRCASFGCEGYLALQNYELQPQQESSATMQSTPASCAVVAEGGPSTSSELLAKEMRNVPLSAGGDSAHPSGLLTRNSFGARQLAGLDESRKTAPLLPSVCLYTSASETQGEKGALPGLDEVIPYVGQPALGESAPGLISDSGSLAVRATRDLDSRADEDRLRASAEAVAVPVRRRWPRTL